MFKKLAQKLRPPKTGLLHRITIEHGEILAQSDCDAILFFMPVNLAWGGNLNAAILNKAGATLDDYIMENVLKPKAGEVFCLPAFEAPYKNIFMAVLAEWDGGVDFEERDLLNCYRRAIAGAQQQGIKKIAIPALGRDKRDFPHIRFASMAIQGILETLGGSIEEVRIVCVDKRMLETYKQQIARAASRA